MTRIYILDQSGLSISGHNFGYSACIAEAARQMHFDVVLLTNVRLSERFPVDKGVRVLPVFTWREAGRGATISWQPGNMAYEMVKAFSIVPPSAEDHVLLHTIWSTELRALLSYLVSCAPTMEMPRYHILLRFDPSEMGQNLASCFPYLRRVRASAMFSERIHFHSDTHLLSREYAGLLGVPVTIAPIPFLRRGIEGSAARKTSRTGNTPLAAVYLGVARPEKGFHYLPGAVAYLWKRYLVANRLRLVIQSHFESPDGESGTLETCQELMAMPENSVKLVSKPLSPEDYIALVCDCDIVVIPYFPTSYRLRSSGVLVEALALGKVVVTTAGSWMSTQVTREHAVLFSDPDGLGPAIAEAVDHFETLQAGAVARREYWWRWSSGDHFVRHLLDVAERSSKPVPMHPSRILFILDNATLGPHAEMDCFAHAQLSYLSAAGYRIVGLFICRHPRAHLAGDESWSTGLLDEIAQYSFDRIFVAGPQQPKHHMDLDESLEVNGQSSVRNDLDAAGRFTFDNEIYEFVNKNRIDAAVLNSITDLSVLDVLGLAKIPAVLAIRGLLSFHKAVQGRRAVDECDLEEEMAALTRCDVLLSPSERDAQIIRARLPRAKVVDFGVFLGPQISSLRFLAGAKDLSDVADSCRPAGPDNQLNKFKSSVSNTEFSLLPDLDEIDLLYIGSDDPRDVSDLHWFLQEVYVPYLEGIGISLAVAGAICDRTEWPHGRRLFFIGQVRDFRPLYAAARVVIWPVLHDGGRWIKRLEALRYACPVITTRAAVVAIESKTEGMLVRDDAASFAAAVVHLVSVPTERRKYAEVSAAVYLRVCDPTRHLRTMTMVLSTVLGDRALPSPGVSTQAPEATSRIEWSPLIRAINNFVRAFLEGDGVSRQSLACIAAAPATEANQILADVYRALFVGRDAPILASKTWLGELICAGPESIPYCNLLAALQIALSDFKLPTIAQASGTLHVIANSGMALGIAALTATFEYAHRGSIWANGSVIPTRRSVATIPGLVCGIISATRSGIGRLRPVEIGFGIDARDGFWPPCVVVAQQVPLSPDLCVLGHRVFEAGWRFSRDRRGATIGNTEVGTLRVPRVAAGLGTEFIDLLCDGPERSISELVIKVGDEIADIQRWTFGRYCGCRVLIVRPTTAGDFGYRQVTIENLASADVIEVVEIFAGTVIGDLVDGQRILSARPWGALENSPLALPGGETGITQRALRRVLSGQAVDPLDLRYLTQMVERGKMLPTGNASEECLQEIAAGKAGIDRSGIATENLLALAHARRVKDIRQIMIVSPALTVEGIDRKGRVTARRNGANTGLARRSWLLHRRRLAEAERFKITLPALDDAVTGHLAVGLRGFYRKEDGSGSPFRWTGPDPSSEIILPIALTWVARVDIAIADLGLNRRAADLSVLQNGVPVAHELLLQDNGRARLHAVFRPKEKISGTLVLGIIARRMHRSAGVERRQGIAIESLDLTMEFPRGLMPGVQGLLSRMSGWVTPRRMALRKLIAHGDRARDQRDWQAASAWYRKALEADPGRAAIWVQLGHTLKEQGDLAGGEEAYRQSLKIADFIADTHLQLGHVLKLQGRMSEAGEAYFRALLVENDFTYARLELEALGYSRSIIDEALAAGGLPLR